MIGHPLGASLIYLLSGSTFSLFVSYIFGVTLGIKRGGRAVLRPKLGEIGEKNAVLQNIRIYHTMSLAPILRGNFERGYGWGRVR